MDLIPLGALGALLGALGALLGTLGALLGVLGTFLVALGLSGASFGRFWVDCWSIFSYFSSNFQRFFEICIFLFEVWSEHGYFTKYRKNIGKTEVFQ